MKARVTVKGRVKRGFRSKRDGFVREEFAERGEGRVMFSSLGFQGVKGDFFKKIESNEKRYGGKENTRF